MVQQDNSGTKANVPTALTPDKDPAAIEKARSTKLLEKARQEAHKSRKYDSAAARALMSDGCLECKGFRPHSWQLDVAEAVLLGLDTVLIAGTGSGKTLPFVLPLFADKTGYSKVIIVSTLNELEKEQVSHYMRTCIILHPPCTRILTPATVYRLLPSTLWEYLRQQ